MYSRGAPSIAEQIGSSLQEAQDIITNFYKSFPKVEQFVKDSEAMAKNLGYVEDYWGRRRRLPDILLPRFTIRYKDKDYDPNFGEFNPFLICKNRVNNNLIDGYKNQLEKAKSRKQIEDIKIKAEKDGIEIINNGGFISQAQRQCVNARIQGSAATMTKMAMVKIFNDKRLKELGFRLLIGVHDELIGECPVENLEEVSKLFSNDMATCVGDNFDVPFKCDVDPSFNWYFADLCSVIKEQYEELVEKGKSPKDSFAEITKEHSELEYNNLIEVIFRDFTKDETEEVWMNRFKEICA